MKSRHQLVESVDPSGRVPQPAGTFPHFHMGASRRQHYLTVLHHSRSPVDADRSSAQSPHRASRSGHWENLVAGRVETLENQAPLRSGWS